jgi:hypothetical protein
MKRPAAALGLSAASLLLLGGVAYGAVQAIDTQPAPQVVVPAASQSSEPTATSLATRASSDDGATHDVGDDHGGATTSNSGRGGADDPATHDATDDHGGTSGGSGSGGSGSGSDDSGSGGHGSDG